MSERKFILGKEPFIRKADNRQSTSVMMLDFMIALTPLIIFAWIKNGILPFINGDANLWQMLYPFIFVLLGGVFSLLIEYVYYFITYIGIVLHDPKAEKSKFLELTHKKVGSTLETSYALIPGVLLAMVLSYNTPIWVLFFGCIFATLIGKLLFGGFGNNIFNPALLGYLFVGVAYYALIKHPIFGFLNPSEFEQYKQLVDGKWIAGATPMTEWAQDRIAKVPVLIEKYGLMKMFLGLTPGSLAETSAVLCLVSFIYLLVRRVITWIIPVIYVGTVFVLTYIIGAYNGYQSDLSFALFGILNGGLMFGAVFMATEPVTSPRSPNGKVIFALGLAVLTVLLRWRSNNPEGVASAILIMNLFTIIIDRIASRLRVSENVRKVVLTYSVIGLIFVGISAYTVSGFVTTAPQISVEYTEKTQNYETFKFEYRFDIKGEEVVVTTDQTYKITSISNNDYNNDEYKAIFNETILKNKFNQFVVGLDEDATTLTVIVKTKGFSGLLTSEVVFDSNNRIIDIITNTSDESYEEYDNWAEANGHPKVIMPPRIIAAQDDLDTFKNPVGGATVTSDAITDAAVLAKEFMEYLLASTNLRMTAKSQDLSTLNFNYFFRKGQDKIIISVNNNYEIQSISNNEYDTADFRADFTNQINSSKFFEYISGVQSDATSTTITVLTSGYASTITSTFTYNNNKELIATTSDTTEESYEFGPGYSDANGNFTTTFPSRIIENKDDLDKVEYISGASVTSKAIIRAAKLAKAYMEAQ